MRARSQNRVLVVLPRLLGGLLASAFLSSCSLSTTVILENATSRSVTIAYEDNDQKTAEVTISPRATVEIPRLLAMQFSIRTKESVSSYERASVPEEYVYEAGWGPFIKLLVKAQLEGDGCIYLVREKEKLLDRQHMTQPPGFPICPVTPKNQNSVPRK